MEMYGVNLCMEDDIRLQPVAQNKPGKNRLGRRRCKTKSMVKKNNALQLRS
jgi:hypothetical protein